MPSVTGRRLFFGTKSDLAPGLRAVEQAEPLEFVEREARDDKAFTVVQTLSDHPHLGLTAGRDVNNSPRYLVFPRGRIPEPRGTPQRRGGIKYVIEPTADCLILRCGGLHETGALFAGELQQPLKASRIAVNLYELFSRELFQGFARVQLYLVGPEALRRLREGQRLVTINLRSPQQYDLAEPK